MINSLDALILDFQPLELWEKAFLLFKPTTTWCNCPPWMLKTLPLSTRVVPFCSRLSESHKPESSAEPTCQMEMAHKRAQPAQPKSHRSFTPAIAATLPRSILSFLCYLTHSTKVIQQQKVNPSHYIYLKSFKLPDLKHYQIAITKC